jgi:hypothetical protein
MESTYLLDEYASVTPGQAYRLFPFGKIVKNGKTRMVTPELAAKFRLPHFKPPIKRGGHAEDAPAGGFIIGLEVREDGLYAIPEWNEKGAQAVVDGDFRYHSPEVVWDEGPVFETPDGGTIYGPLIVGDALLHMPHLGEAAALYSVEPLEREEQMTIATEMVEVPKKWYDGILEFFKAGKPEPELEPEPTPQVEVEAYEAAVKERDEYKAKLATLEAEAEKTARIDKYTAAIAETKANHELAQMLADLPDETADRFVQEFKALSSQIDESALLGEKGTSGDGLPEVADQALDAAVKAKMAEHNVNYNAALQMVQDEAPELVANYYKGG